MASGQLSTFAFVFDMNQLFEAFVVNFIRRHPEDVLPSTLRDCDLLPQSGGETCYLARSSDGAGVFRLKPDLVFRQGGTIPNTFPLLMDTKYKALKPNERKLGINQADFYQMHAYAHRYGCPRVLLLYPQKSDMTALPVTWFSMEGSHDKAIAVASVDLQIKLTDVSEREKLIKALRGLFDALLNAELIPESNAGPSLTRELSHGGH